MMNFSFFSIDKLRAGASWRNLLKIVHIGNMQFNSIGEISIDFLKHIDHLLLTAFQVQILGCSYFFGNHVLIADAHFGIIRHHAFG